MGALLRLPRVRFVGSYDYYFDLNNQRGYEQSVSAFVGVNVYGQSDVFVKIQMRGERYMILQTGVSVNF